MVFLILTAWYALVEKRNSLNKTQADERQVSYDSNCPRNCESYAWCLIEDCVQVRICTLILQIASM